MALREPGDDVEAEAPGRLRHVGVLGSGQQVVGRGELGGRHADAGVLDDEQVRSRRPVVGAALDHHGSRGRRVAGRVLDQLGDHVGEVGDRAAREPKALVDDEGDAVEVLGLGDARAHDVAQGDRGRPHAGRLLAGEHEQALGVAPDPGGEVVETEEVGQRVGVALALLEIVDDVQLPVEHALVAPREVQQQFGREFLLAHLGVVQFLRELDTASLLVLRDLHEDRHSDAREEDRETVDQRPQPRRVLSGVVVEEQRRHQERAEAVAHGGEDDVDHERHPVLVQHQEADDHEEREVRLDVASGEDHQPGAGGGEAGRHEDHAGQAPGREPAARGREQRDEGDHRGEEERVADDEPEDQQERRERDEHREEEMVAPLPGRVVDHVPPREVVHDTVHAGDSPSSGSTILSDERRGTVHAPFTMSAQRRGRRPPTDRFVVQDVTQCSEVTEIRVRTTYMVSVRTV